MKVLIVEDEISAFEYLKSILADMFPDMEIAGNTQSVVRSVEWLEQNQPVDLIFMDIHLSDGSVFDIFERTKIDIPVIFTTAYDQYAIEAFKFNSIDYLLKPVRREELERSVNKFMKFTRPQRNEYIKVVEDFSNKKKPVRTMIVPNKDKLFPVRVSDIAYFYTSNKSTEIVMFNGMKYPYNRTLDQISQTLDSNDFFRVNKQFLVNRVCIADMTVWFDKRLLLNLTVATPERVFISKNRTTEFKAWIMEG